MIGLLRDVIAMLMILANEREDPEEGGEIWPMAGERTDCHASAAALARNDTKEARA